MHKFATLTASLEDDSIPVGVIDEQTVTAQADAATGAVQADSVEVEVFDNLASEAEGDIDTLTDIQDVVAASPEGLSPEAAEITEIAVESLRARLGLPATRSLPALESFASTNSRKTATSVALESIGDSIKAAWQKLLSFLKMVFEKVWSFIQGLVKSRPMINAQIKRLQDRAKAVPDDAKPKAKVVNAGAKSLGIKGKANVSTAAAVADSAVKLMKLSEAAVDAASVYSTAIAVAAASGTSGDELSKDSKNFFDAVAKQVAHLPAAAVASGAAKGSKAYGNFVGGKSFVMTPAAADSEDGAATFSFEANPAAAAKEAEALTREECMTVLDQAAQLMKSLEEFDKHANNINKVKTALQKSADNVIAAVAAGKELTPEAKKSFEKARKAVGATTRSVSMFGARAPGVAFMTAKALADYAAGSLANLGAKAEPKAA